MMPQDLPTCPHCGSPSFAGGGGSFSPGFNQQSFRCNGCGAHITLAGHSGGSLLVYFRHDQMLPTEYDDMWKYPEEWATWMNKVMIPTWRFRESEVEKHDSAEWRQWLAEVFYPAFPSLKGYRTEEQIEKDRPSYFTDTTVSYHDCPPEAQKLMDDQFHKGDHHKNAKQRGTYLPLPQDLIEPVYPPQAPDGYAMYYWHPKHGWCAVSPAVSQGITPPEDPILTSNRNFFNDVWAAVAENLGIDLPERAETKNRYGGIEPWYTFTLDGAEVIIGWRKRVVSMHATIPDDHRPLDTTAMKALADRDNVTYEAHGPTVLRTAEDLERLIREESATRDKPYDEDTITMLVEGHRERYPEGEVTRDGGWKNDMPEAHQVLIHAWGKDKTVEYLTTLCQTIQAAA